MSEKNVINYKGVEINTYKALKLRNKILALEKSNLKTKEKSNTEMIDALKTLIEEEVE